MAIHESGVTIRSDTDPSDKTIRSIDWSETPLGTIDNWPRVLKTTVDIAAGADEAMLVIWGSKQISLYNQRFARLIGERHPDALGRPFDELVSESADELCSLIRQARSDESPQTRAIPMPPELTGRSASTCFQCQAIPIAGKAGTTDGVLVIFTPSGKSTAISESTQKKLRSLETILGSTEDFVYIFDCDKKFIYANEALLERLQKYLGVPPSDVLGSNFEDLGYPPEVAEKYSDLLDQVLSTGQSVRDEERQSVPSGEMATFEYIFVPVVGDDGQVEAVAGLTRDITEINRTASALEATEHLYQTLFESVDQGVGILEVLLDDGDASPDIRWIDVNDKFEQISGITDPVGKRGSEVSSFDSDRSWFELYEEIVETGEPRSFENYAQHADRWFDVDAVPVGGPGSRRVAVFFSDISERKHREQNMALLDEFNGLFSRLTDPDDILETVGQKLGEHLGVDRIAFSRIDDSSDELHNLHQWYQPGMEVAATTHRLSDVTTDEILRVLDGGDAIIIDDIDEDPRIEPVADIYRSHNFRSLVAAPHLAEGRLRFALGVYHDHPHTWQDHEIDLICDLADRLWWRLERAYAEEALRKANRRKDRFLAVLSHELRNPLAPIEMSLDLLERTPDNSEQRRGAHRIIRRQVAQLVRLVDDLLDVNRIESNKIELETERIDLDELLRTTVEDHTPLFDEPYRSIEYRGVDDSVRVDADPNRLAQAIGNLLQNAAKFTDEGDEVVVELTKDVDDESVDIRVIDTGKGIAPETIDDLFDPFIQADETLEHTVGGLGLGLPLVRGLVEMHGGAVDAVSDGLGEGSTFIVCLPLAEDQREQRPEHEAPDAEPDATSDGVILIIDDNRDVTDMLAKVLELEGYRVETAYTGPEGLERARAHHPTVVICDIGLPELDGYGVARTLRDDPDYEFAKLIALSGYARPEDLEKSRDAGFDHHLAKPPDINEVTALIDEALGDDE